MKNFGQMVSSQLNNFSKNWTDAFKRFRTRDKLNAIRVKVRNSPNG